MSDRSSFQRFTSELRRRHVPQTVAVYLVAAWAAIQFADVVVPNLNWPQWIVTAVIIAAGVGFPAVVVVAWVFEWGPDGIHRTDDEGLSTATVGREDAGPAATAPGRPHSATPWLAAVAVLGVGIVSALAVAALLAGGDERSETPPSPDVPTTFIGPPGVGDLDSLRERMRRDVAETLDRQGRVQLEGFRAWGEMESWVGLDSGDLADVVDLGRRLAGETGLSIMMQRPEAWRPGPGGGRTAMLARDDTLEIVGLAHDTAGIRSVVVDGRTVAEAESPGETLRFRTRLAGTGSAGIRMVTVVVHTADGREVRGEYRIGQLPRRSP